MTDNLLPHSLDTEQLVLGAILVDPKCFAEVQAIVGAVDFHDARHQLIFEAMSSVPEGIDQVAVVNELKRKDKLAEVGGPAYLSYLVLMTPTSVNAAYCATIATQAGFA